MVQELSILASLHLMELPKSFLPVDQYGYQTSAPGKELSAEIPPST